MQIVMGAQPPDAALIGQYQALDVDIVYPSLPSEKEDTILPILDQWVATIAHDASLQPGWVVSCGR